MRKFLALLTAIFALACEAGLAHAAATATRLSGAAGNYRLDAQGADSAEIVAALAQASGRSLAGAPIAANTGRWTGQFDGSLTQLLRRFLGSQGHVLTGDGRILVASEVKSTQQASAIPAANLASAPAPQTAIAAQAASLPRPLAQGQAAPQAANGRVQRLLRTSLAKPPPAAPPPARFGLRIRDGVVDADPAAQAQIAALTRQAQEDAQAMAAALQAANAGLVAAPRLNSRTR